MVCVYVLCSLIGATLIVSGLYMLLWGKSKETRKDESDIVVFEKKEHIQCDSILSVNSSLACNKKEHLKKTTTSVAPDTSDNNTL